MINAVGNRMTREVNRQARQARQIEQTQIEISTGTRLRRASDNPLAASRVAGIDRDTAAITGWQRNIASASARVTQADSVLGSAAALVARARELMVGAVSDNSGVSGRTAAADELVAIAAELVALGGTRATDGEPLFAANQARETRFGQDLSFAPVPSLRDAFGVNGQLIATSTTDAANAARQGDVAAMNAGLSALAGATAHLADQRAGLGQIGARLERASDALSERQLALGESRSALADTDLSDAIARLNAQQLTLDAAQAAFARINRQTLFDILR